MTESTEPPYTCSVCTVVWEEGHREMSPYPDSQAEESGGFGFVASRN